MREPGASFKYCGVTLYAVEQHNGCLGCIASKVNKGEHPEWCNALKRLEGSVNYWSCGSQNSGVVYVRSPEQFKADIVAWTLVGGNV
jgi:hypothetical protein